MFLKVPYDRPSWFSDPYCDFSPDTIKEVLAVPDNNMKWLHFNQIFQGYLPIGTYEEVVYFLPWALNGIFKGKDPDFYEYIDGMYIWIRNNFEDLTKDGIVESLRSYLYYCFEQWTSEFVVEEFVDSSEKGYLELKFAGAFNVTIENLLKHMVFSEIAVAVVESISTSVDPIKSAWFLDYVAKYRSNSYLHREVIDSSEISSIVTKEESLVRNAKIVGSNVFEDSGKTLVEIYPEYWGNIFKTLELDK